MSETEENGQTLRERKRQRTRALLIETGRRLFDERGYDATTVADIAAAADIGTRTFFGYFDSKEQLLFPEADPRVVSAKQAIHTRAATESPAQVLLRGLGSAAFQGEAADPAFQLRLRLMPTVPAIQARALRAQLDAQEQIIEALDDAYPSLGRVRAAALVGAFVGAVGAVFQALGDTGSVESRTAQVRDTVALTLGPSLAATAQVERGPGPVES